MVTEFLRRYVVLEHEMLSYFDTETSAKANDTIEKRDMLSVTATTDNRCASRTSSFWGYEKQYCAPKYYTFGFDFRAFVA